MAITAIPIFTLPINSAEFNTKKYKSLGAVIGTDRERISGLLTLIDDILSYSFYIPLLGDRDKLIKSRMDDLIRNAKANLIKNTMKEFPNAVAIFDAKFELKNASSLRNYLDCMITGTAVSQREEKRTTRSTTRKSKNKNTK